MKKKRRRLQDVFQSPIFSSAAAVRKFTEKVLPYGITFIVLPFVVRKEKAESSELTKIFFNKSLKSASISSRLPLPPLEKWLSPESEENLLIRIQAEDCYRNVFETGLFLVVA